MKVNNVLINILVVIEIILITLENGSLALRAHQSPSPEQWTSTLTVPS